MLNSAITSLAKFFIRLKLLVPTDPLPSINTTTSAAALQAMLVGADVVGDSVGDDVVGVFVGNDVVGDNVGLEVGDSVVGGAIGDCVGVCDGAAVPHSACAVVLT